MNCTTETNKRMFNELRESSFVEPSLKILPAELFSQILLFLQSPKAISNVACLNKSFREKVKVENSSIHFIPLKNFISDLLLKISETDCIQPLSALEKEVSLNPCYDLKPLKKKLLQFQKAILVVLRSLDRQTFDDLKKTTCPPDIFRHIFTVAEFTLRCKEIQKVPGNREAAYLQIVEDWIAVLRDDLVTENGMYGAEIQGPLEIANRHLLFNQQIARECIANFLFEEIEKMGSVDSVIARICSISNRQVQNRWISYFCSFIVQHHAKLDWALKIIEKIPHSEPSHMYDISQALARRILDCETAPDEVITETLSLINHLNGWELQRLLWDTICPIISVDSLDLAGKVAEAISDEDLRKSAFYSIAQGLLRSARDETSRAETMEQVNSMQSEAAKELLLSEIQFCIEENIIGIGV